MSKAHNAPAPATIRLRVPPGIGGYMVGGTMLQPDAAATISVLAGVVVRGS